MYNHGRADVLQMNPGGGTFDVKIADFGLSALVRIDEDGYDAEESGKRKRYRQLKDVRTLCPHS